MATKADVHASVPVGPSPLIVIAGKGRSGSNRLLDILDASSRTVCRNEVNSIAGGEFNQIGSKLFADNFDDARKAQLQTAIDNAKKRRSGGDRFTQADKAFLTWLGKNALSPMSKSALRRRLHSLGLMHRPTEWEVPTAFVNTQKLSEASLVLKLNSSPIWTAEIAHKDPRSRIVHNIRNPYDFLQSWYNRFIVGKGRGFRPFEKRIADVPRILEYFGREDADRLMHSETENLVEVELWRWRYANELFLELSSLEEQYLRVTYDEVENDRMATAENLYRFAGLPFDRAAEARVTAMQNVLFKKSHQTKLDQDFCKNLVERVLSDSPLKDLF